MTRAGAAATAALALSSAALICAGCDVQPLLTVGRQCGPDAPICAAGLVCDPVTRLCARPSSADAGSPRRDGPPTDSPVAVDLAVPRDGPRPDRTLRDSAIADTTRDTRPPRADVALPDSSVDSGSAPKLSCLINAASNTDNCSGKVVRQGSWSSNRARFRVDLSGCQRMRLTLRICNAAGFAFHVANSTTNDGHGGDAGTFSNDSELQVNSARLDVHPNDSNPAGSGSIYNVPTFASTSGCVDRTLTIRDGEVQVGSGVPLSSPYIFRLGQPDSEGSPDELVYLGINRVYSAISPRVGSGLITARVELY